MKGSLSLNGGPESLFHTTGHSYHQWSNFKFIDHPHLLHKMIHPIVFGLQHAIYIDKKKKIKLRIRQ